MLLCDRATGPVGGTLQWTGDKLSFFLFATWKHGQLEGARVRLVPQNQNNDLKIQSTKTRGLTERILKQQATVVSAGEPACFSLHQQQRLLLSGDPAVACCRRCSIETRPGVILLMWAFKTH